MGLVDLRRNRDVARLKELYAPFEAVDVPCEEGCDDCCSPVPFSPLEWSLVMESNPSFEHEDGTEVRIVVDQDGQFLPQKVTRETGEPLWCCMFKKSPETGGGCGIYELRPFICRIYATCKAMPCVERGVRPAAPCDDRVAARHAFKYTVMSLGQVPFEPSDEDIDKVLTQFENGKEFVKAKAEAEGKVCYQEWGEGDER